MIVCTPASDSALLVSFGDAISFETHSQVISLFQSIERLGDPRIHNLHPAYASLLIDFDPLRISHHDMESLVVALSGKSGPAIFEDVAPTEIPVCYDPEFGPDLANIAGHAHLTEDQVVGLHSGSDYFVFFLGFSPGFAYLGGLPRELQVPRLPTPRKHVPAGTVAIAGEQTGIYPNDSPGGWQLIGRTPLRMFDPEGDPPSRLGPGDRVRFRRIDRVEFDRLAS